jgi:N12 class adenine-specific DNA methylase
MGEQTQYPAGLGKIFFCPAEEFERLGMAAPMQEINWQNPRGSRRAC